MSAEQSSCQHDRRRRKVYDNEQRQWVRRVTTPSNDNSTQNLEVNVNTPYLFILSGADDWQISEVGKSSSIFIIDSGKASKTESINYSTYNFPNYLKYPKNPRYHESWIHRITSGIGKPIFITCVLILSILLSTNLLLKNKLFSASGS